MNLNGLKFETDLVAGHKTGLYLDQQVNYQAVSQFAKGAQVLDCFSFLGGFGLHAARAGAAHVHLLDQSAEAIAASKRNAAANGLAEKCSFEAVNVFDWLKAQTAVKPHEKVIPRFDLIILDPPSFTRNRASVPDALRGYKEIHLRALKLLKPGGTLATFCCSHHVDAATVSGRRSCPPPSTRATSCAAWRPIRNARTIPIIPMIPETEYLKGFAFEVVQIDFVGADVRRLTIFDLRYTIYARLRILDEFVNRKSHIQNSKSEARHLGCYHYCCTPTR